MRKALPIIAAGLLCAAASTASAQLYKWVDENGVVNYGDFPPSGVKLQPITRGTVSSVSDRALAGPAVSAPAPRDARRTGSSGGNRRNEAPSQPASGSQGSADAAAAYPLYDGYPLRPVVAAEALADRRPGSVLPPRPILPTDGIREMPRPVR